MRLYTLSQVFNKNIYIVLSVDTLKMRLYTLSHIMNQNALLWLWGSMNYVHLWLRRIPFFFQQQACTTWWTLCLWPLTAVRLCITVMRLKSWSLFCRETSCSYRILQIKAFCVDPCWWALSLLFFPFLFLPEKAQFFVYSFGWAGGCQPKSV